MCAQPAPHVLQMCNHLISNPKYEFDLRVCGFLERKYGTLSKTTGASCSREQILTELRNYRDQCVASMRDRIELVINSVEWMGSGGETQLYTFAFSSEGTRIEFVGIAVRQSTPDALFDYSKYSYTYVQYEKLQFPYTYCLWDENSRNLQWVHDPDYHPPLSEQDRDLAEALFIYELVKMGAARITDDNCLALA